MRRTRKDARRDKARYTEFDCLVCDAYNPYDDGFRVGDDVLCLYCGQRFIVKRDGDESFRLKEN